MIFIAIQDNPQEGQSRIMDYRKSKYYGSIIPGDIKYWRPLDEDGNNIPGIRVIRINYSIGTAEEWDGDEWVKLKSVPEFRDLLT